LYVTNEKSKQVLKVYFSIKTAIFEFIPVLCVKSILKTKE